MKFHFLQSDQVIGVELAESAGCWMRMRMLSVWRSLVGARLRWGHDTVEKTGGCRPWTLSLLSWLRHCCSLSRHSSHHHLIIFIIHSQSDLKAWALFCQQSSNYQTSSSTVHSADAGKMAEVVNARLKWW